MSGLARNGLLLCVCVSLYAIQQFTIIVYNQWLYRIRSVHCVRDSVFGKVYTRFDIHASNGTQPECCCKQSKQKGEEISYIQFDSKIFSLLRWMQNVWILCSLCTILVLCVVAFPSTSSLAKRWAFYCGCCCYTRPSRNKFTHRGKKAHTTGKKCLRIGNLVVFSLFSCIQFVNLIYSCNVSCLCYYLHLSAIVSYGLSSDSAVIL